MVRRLLKMGIRGFKGAEHVHFADFVISSIFDWRPWAIGMASGLLSFLGIPAIRDWSPLSIILVSIVVGACISIIYIGVNVFREMGRSKRKDRLAQNAPTTPDIKPQAESDMPDVRVADSPRVCALFENNERDKIFPLLESERLKVWVRSMKGDDKLLLLRGNTWRTHFFMYLPNRGEGTQNQTFVETQTGQQSVWFDVYLSQRQLEEFWPELEWVPILTAAKIVYEGLEEYGVDDIISSSKISPSAKLTFFIDTMVRRDSNEIQMKGKKPPSTVHRPVPDEERKKLHHIADTNNLKPIWPGDANHYNDVQIIRADLNPFIEWFRKLAQQKI